MFPSLRNVIIITSLYVSLAHLKSNPVRDHTFTFSNLDKHNLALAPYETPPVPYLRKFNAGKLSFNTVAIVAVWFVIVNAANVWSYEPLSFTNNAEINKNIMIRNSTTSGSRIDIQVSLGSGRSYLSLEQDYDINLFAPSGGTKTTTIAHLMMILL